MTNGGAPTPETIQKRLRRLRAERGLSQRELAALTTTDGGAVSHAHISRIEAGGRRPSVDVVRKLARALGVSPEYLESGAQISEVQGLELRLNDAELRLRLSFDPLEAESAMRAVRDAAERLGATELVARAEAVLGLAAAAAGRQREAITRLTRATKCPLFTPTTRPDVFRTLILAHLAADEPKRAAKLAEHCLVDVERLAPDDVVARIQYATYLSAAFTDMGNFVAAHDALAGLEDRLHTVDEYSQVRLHWAASRLAATEGNSRLAIEEMEQAIVVLRKTEDSLQLARAHMVCAEILGWGGRPEEALRHLGIFEQLLARPDHPDMGEACAMRALCLAKLGRVAEAHELALQALEILGETRTGNAAAWYAIALGLAHHGDVDGSDEAFSKVLPQLEAVKAHAWASQVCRDWASMLADVDVERALPLSMKAEEHGKRAEAKALLRR